MKNTDRSLYLSALSERHAELGKLRARLARRSSGAGAGGGGGAGRAPGCAERGSRGPGGSSLPVIHAPSSVGKRDAARHGSGTERRRKRLPHPSQLSPFPKLVRAIWILQPELRSGSGRVVRSILHFTPRHLIPPFFAVHGSPSLESS